jgi:hypothetical protein
VHSGPIDPTNPVVALCAEGMAAEGEPAEAVADGRAAGFLASLYLNLGDAQVNVGELAKAAASARAAAAHLTAVPPGGYRELVALGIRRLVGRAGGTPDGESDA